MCKERFEQLIENLPKPFDISHTLDKPPGLLEELEAT